MTEHDAAVIVEQLPGLVNGDAALVRRGRFLTTRFLLEVGTASYLVAVVEGRIAAIERGPFLLRSWTFAVRGPLEAWERFWKALPEPGEHDIFAMVKQGRTRLEGDLQPLMANLRYVKDVLAVPRRLARNA